MVLYVNMIKQGELILLYKDYQRNYLIRIVDKRFHTDKGYIDLKEIIGKDFGAVVKTSMEESFYLLKPTLFELIMKVHRKTQIIYPKDIGIILTQATIFPGARVIEVGSGSGALTSALAHYVRPDGLVYSYERRKDLMDNEIGRAHV